MRSLNRFRLSATKSTAPSVWSWGPPLLREKRVLVGAGGFAIFLLASGQAEATPFSPQNFLTTRTGSGYMASAIFQAPGTVTAGLQHGLMVLVESVPEPEPHPHPHWKDRVASSSKTDDHEPWQHPNRLHRRQSEVISELGSLVVNLLTLGLVED